MSERLGRQFGWLWSAYAISTAGTWLAFDAFSMLAILVLNVDAAQVSLLAAAGLAVGALVAVPLGPWVEFRSKRPVMISMDLVRFLALISVPVAYFLDVLSYWQLAVVAIVVAAADVTFTAASGAYLKALMPRPSLLTANARFESTTWTATILGPPLGGAAIAVFGPISTVVLNAISFVLSAIGIRCIGGVERPPSRVAGFRAAELRAGWDVISADPILRRLFANTVLVNALILAPLPLLAVLMMGHLGFAPWQYALSFALPCVGGILGARLAGPLVARFGQSSVLRTAGVARSCWPLGLAFVMSGGRGMALVIAVQFGLVLCCGVFNPVYATYRLDRLPLSHAARALSAWSISTKTTTALMTAAWGLAASIAGPRAAIGLAGALLLATPLLLPRRLPAAASPGVLAPA
ncbi:MAG: MFS transporter [Nocardiaceae bacterium]|nr:MFS transporter [Nocardiaceae bacterium]